MARLSYDSVEALIYDPVAANRSATRDALYALGFRRTESVPSLESFVEAVGQHPYDLALAEAQGAGEGLCAAIRQIRQGLSGENPFSVIIVTAWEMGTGLAGRVLASGADDLLLRPFSTGLLGQRIEAHIERRKGFVVTDGYVGPDRRTDPGRPRGSAGTCFDPPNSLKMKAKDRLPAEAVALQVGGEARVVRERLAAEMLRRDSIQVCVQWRLMQAGLPAAGTAAPERLTELAHAIARRCPETGQLAARAACERVLAASGDLSQADDRAAAVAALGEAALGLHRIFYPAMAEPERLAQIDAAVMESCDGDLAAGAAGT